MSEDTRCFYCGHDMPETLIYWQVKGWVRKRAKGGTNALVGEQRTGLKACESCVRKLKDGVPPGQLTL